MDAEITTKGVGITLGFRNSTEAMVGRNLVGSAMRVSHELFAGLSVEWVQDFFRRLNMSMRVVG